MTDNFLIVASPRSGSNYLCDLLNEQAGVKCYLEVFHPDEVPLRLRDWTRFGKAYTPEYRDQHPEKFIRHLFSRKRPRMFFTKKVGVKLLIHDHQIEYGLKPLFKHVNKIIFLERRNKLAWYASLKMAMETGNWFNHPEKSSNHQIVFDEKNYLDHVNAETLYFNKVISALSLSRHQYLYLHYEDIKSTETIHKIAEFLEIPSIIRPDANAWSKPRNFLNSFSNAQAVVAFAEKNGLNNWI